VQCIRVVSLAELGITSLTIPEALGGMEQPMTDLVPLMETPGEALVLEPVPWSGVRHADVAALPVGPSRDARLAALPVAMRAAQAGVEEPGVGKTPQPTVIARRVGDAWQLDGDDAMVMGGTDAHHFIVAATLDDGSLGLFDLPADASGVVVQGYRFHDGRARRKCS
jgi:acyl-CoA dehydrogenase